ncbi:MAG: DUF433 domain-containing protein [Planctomycetes bacterium]|nr:DUF433 domain-containing protein [Planctomycetota bacterium]
MAGSRVSLASIVHAYWEGDTPEAIVQSFPTLTLEQVYGAIAYYLARREHVDLEMEGLDRKWDELRSAAKVRNRELRARILAAREKTRT